MPDDDVSIAELARSLRRIERTLEGVVLRAVYDVQMVAMTRTLADLQARVDRHDEDNKERARADQSRNRMLAITLVGAVCSPLATFFLVRVAS